MNRPLFLAPALLGLLVLGAAPASAPAQSAQELAIGRQLDGWYRLAQRRAPGQWGIAVADQNGQLLWGVRPDKPMVPASTVKLLTTGFARSVLGGNARRPTRVIGNGIVDSASGEWLGSWSLQLNGDPSLERGVGAGPTLAELAEQLRARGIRRLSGPLAVQSADGPAEATYPASWAPHHRGRLFAPLIGPLTVHENLVHLVVRPAAQGRPARLDATSPHGLERIVTMKARTTAGTRARLSLQQGATGWTVTGTIGARSRPRTLSATVRDPLVVLRAAWASALADTGIEWDAAPMTTFDSASTPPTVLAEVLSPPLDTLALEINRRSYNLGAELLLQWAGGRGETAAERLTEHVRDLTGREDAVLVDGSGLSYEGRVSPATFTAYLARFPNTPGGRNFPLLLPANGTGTLRRLGTGPLGQGVVRAKTGTLANVSTVVGYLGHQDGVLLVSLMYSGGRPLTARREQWKLFRLLGAEGIVIPPEVEEDDGDPPTLGGDPEGDGG